MAVAGEGGWRNKRGRVAIKEVKQQRKWQKKGFKGRKQCDITEVKCENDAIRSENNAIRSENNAIISGYDDAESSKEQRGKALKYQKQRKQSIESKIEQKRNQKKLKVESVNSR